MAVASKRKPVATPKARAVRKPAPSTKPHRIYSMSVASVYPHYVAKAERKGRTKAEVDDIIRWLTGYTQRQLDAHLQKKTAFEAFFAQAAGINPLRHLISGVVCGVRIENIEEPLMKEIRYLDKLIDELAAGRSMEKILRKADAITPGVPKKSKAPMAQAGRLPNIGAPATRALAALGVTTTAQAAKYSARELLALHGFGPKALAILERALADKKLSLKRN